MWRLSSPELLDRLREIEQQVRALLVDSLDTVAEIDRRGIAKEHGCTSTSALVQQMLRMTPSEANNRVRLAGALCPTLQPSGAVVPPKLPAMAEAVREGEATLDHARITHRFLASLGNRVAAESQSQAEEFLAHHARTLTPNQLKTLAAQVKLRLDPDGVLDDEKDAVEG